MAAESGARGRRRNGLLLRNPTNPRSVCYGVAGVDRRTDTSVVAQSGCGRVAEKNKSPAKRSARHHVVDDHDPGFAARIAKKFERLIAVN